MITCGKCEYCTKGREHLCPSRIILGMNNLIERQGVLQNLYQHRTKIFMKFQRLDKRK